MKLAKSLLLSSAVGLTAVASAQAADLPFRKAAPVEYVRVCDFTGAGYFYIPGTDTCLKIGGFARAEYAYLSPSAAFFPTTTAVTGAAPFSQRITNLGTGAVTQPTAVYNGTTYGTRIGANLRDVSGFFARGRIEADARTQTAYGTLRTFVRFEITKANGVYQGSSTSQQSYVNGNAGAANVDKAFIQFAGFTAGRVQSFFDFYADNYNFEGIANSDQSTQVFAYTATFGGGFSATISAEDPAVRRAGILNVGNPNSPSSGYSNNGVAFNQGLTATYANSVDSLGNNVVTQSFGVNTGAGAYGSERIPDFVGAIRLDQAWGAAQLSAAYHEVAINTSFGSTTRDGFAVQGGVQIKLPMLAAGDDIWLQGAYQQGAYLYQDSAATMNSGVNSLFLGGFQHPTGDAAVILNGAGNGYTVSLGEGFSVAGALHHYFTPNFSDVLFGSYEELSFGGAAKSTSWRYGGIGDASEYRIGNQFIWTPVNNLSVGIEAVYAKLDQTIPGGVDSQTAFNSLHVKKNPDSFEGRVRVERDF